MTCKYLSDKASTAHQTTSSAVVVNEGSTVLTCICCLGAADEYVQHKMKSNLLDYVALTGIITSHHAAFILAIQLVSILSFMHASVTLQLGEHSRHGPGTQNISIYAFLVTLTSHLGSRHQDVVTTL